MNASFTLVVELVEAKHRRLASMGLMIAFSIGEAFVGVFATFIPEWRDYHFYQKYSWGDRPKGGRVPTTQNRLF